MAWQDNLQNIIFTIRTGDGKLWYPDWKPERVSKEFNNTVYDFINQKGSYVDRREAKSSTHSITFYFQGADVLEVSKDFYLSADDKRPWQIKHPYYGDLNGQPLRLERGDESYNLVAFTVEFWETIGNSYPKTKISVAEGVSSKVNKFHTITPDVYASKVSLKPADINTITSNAQRIKNLVTGAADAVYYNTAVQVANKALSAATDMILAPAAGISAIHDMVLQVARFGTGITTRLNLLATVLESALNVAKLNPTRNNKYYYENIGGISIAAMALAVAYPLEGDFYVKSDVKKTSDFVLKAYISYTEILDEFYTSSPDLGAGFDATPLTRDSLLDAVNSAVIGLTEVAFDAKQERLVYLDRDSNIIVLAHKYLGLASDDNIELFRNINGIKNKGVFLLDKGTQIRYYV